MSGIHMTEDGVRLTVDKFIFKFPIDLRYSDAGLWMRGEAGLARLGLSDFLQQRSGDIAFVHLAPAGSLLEAGDEIASIETVKVNLSLPSPVKGTVLEINTILEESPEWIHQEPYGRGWMVILRPEETGHEPERLMDAKTYAGLAKEQAKAEIQR